MSKIIGVTVGTPTSPAKMEEALNIVVTQPGDTLAWDGNAEGRTTVDYVGFAGNHERFVHISDATPTLADIPDEGISGTEVVLANFYEWSATKEELAADHPGILAWAGRIVSVSAEAVGTAWQCPISIPMPGTDGSIEYTQVVFPKAGLYFNQHQNGDGVRSMTIPGYTGFGVRKINPELLADVYEKLNGANADKNGQNIHAQYFAITEDGVLSLKPEYRGEPTKNTYADAISDMGVGVAGSKNPELPEHLVIPETVDIGGIVGDVAVDRIADGAFYGNKAIKIVTFPKTVNEIPNGCFQNSFAENVYNTEHVTTIGAAAFKYSNIKNVNLPNLTSMGEGAFMSCSYLTHANIGNVAEIPADCFYKDYALSRVESNHKVVSVDHTAFQNTPRLANADFVQNLTSIGAGAFIKSGLEYDWNKLQNCTFGNNATALQINPTDFWSDCSVTPCENSVKPVFSQKDPRWADRQIGKSGKTYGQGCMLFSIMNMFCGINNLDISTVEEFEEIVEGIKPGHLDTYTLSMRDVPTFVEPLGLEASLIDGFHPYSLQKLYDALADGKYAIVHTSSGAIDGSMSGHAITAYGLTPTGKIMFADSSRRYYNEPMAGGGKYALPYKVTTANQSADNPEFCIISKPIAYSRYATIEDALAETNEVADGVVGAYTDRFGKYHIALLGDMESATTINIQRDCTFHLNGYTLTFTAADAYLNISNAKDVIIDGTVVRKDAHTSNMRKGTIKKDGVSNTSGNESLIKTTGTNLTVYGGVYSITNITTPDKKRASAFSAGVSDPVATIRLNDCSIIASGSGQTKAYGVLVDSAVVNNCVIETETVDGYSSAVYVYVDAVINNSTLTSEATSNGPAQCVSSSSSCTKFDIANTTIRATVNGYSANNDNHAIGVQAVDGMIATITDCDIAVNRVGVDESDYTDTPETASIHKHQGGGTVILNGTNNLVPAYP